MNANLRRYEAEIWEKAEHWAFDVTIEARDETHAWAIARRDYPRRHYSIRSLQQVWRPEAGANQ